VLSLLGPDYSKQVGKTFLCPSSAEGYLVLLFGVGVGAIDLVWIDLDVIDWVWADKGVRRLVCGSRCLKDSRIRKCRMHPTPF